MANVLASTSSSFEEPNTPFSLPFPLMASSILKFSKTLSPVQTSAVLSRTSFVHEQVAAAKLGPRYRQCICYGWLAVVSDVDDGGFALNVDNERKVCRAITKQVQQSDAGIEVVMIMTGKTPESAVMTTQAGM
jgi:hypothetical protein